MQIVYETLTVVFIDEIFINKRDHLKIIKVEGRILIYPFLII